MNTHFNLPLTTLGAREELTWLLRLLFSLVDFRQTGGLVIRRMCTLTGVVRHVRTRESKWITELSRNLT
jgi:hypothetical protein